VNQIILFFHFRPFFAPFLDVSVASICPAEPATPKRAGAILLIRKVPEIEFLNLIPHTWCITTAEAEEDEKTIAEAARAKILSVTGLTSEEIKVFPNITKEVSFTKKDSKKISIAYRLAEASPLAEVKAKHQWVKFEEAVNIASGCQDLADLIKQFHAVALEQDSEWKLDFEKLNFKEAMASATIGKWYKDSQKEDTAFRVLERKDKTVHFEVNHPASKKCISSSSSGGSFRASRYFLTQGEANGHCYCPTLPKSRCHKVRKWLIGVGIGICITVTVALLITYHNEILAALKF